MFGVYTASIPAQIISDDAGYLQSNVDNNFSDGGVPLYHGEQSNARFTLCSRRPRQSRFRPPWTKRDGRETTRGDGMGNVTGRDCRGCRSRFLNCQKICHGSHGADEKPSRP